MRRLFTFALLLTLGAGCSSGALLASPRRTAGPNGATPAQPAPAAGVSDEPLTAINQVATYLQQYGYRAAGPAVHHQGLTQGNLIAYALDAQAGVCYAAVAVGAANTDLDMVVLDPQGRTVDHDVQTDTHPHVSFCTRQAGRHVARLQMSSGSGEFYYILFAGPRVVENELSTFFDASSAQQQVALASLDVATQQRIDATDRALGRQRYQRAGTPQGVHMSPRNDRDYPLELAQGYCYTLAAFGGPGTSDTDLFVVDADGNELARDASTDRDARVEFCPPAAGAYHLRARLYAGNGPVFVASWVRAQDAGAAVPTEVAEGVISTESMAAAGLDENHRLIHADMQARGYESYGDVARGELAEGASARFNVELEGGKCYAILSVGDNGVRDLDLIVRGAQGQEIDRDIEANAKPIVRVCPDETGEQEIEVRMANGGGRFIYAAYRWPRGTRGPFGISGLMYVRLAEVTSLLSVEGYTPSVDFSPDDGRLRSDQSKSHRLTLPAGKCYSILTVAGRGLHDIDLTVEHGGTALATDGTRNAFPDVRFCTTDAGRYDLEVRAAHGSGDYFYQIFERAPQ